MVFNWFSQIWNWFGRFINWKKFIKMFVNLSF